MALGTRGPVKSSRTAQPPIDPRRLTDAQLAVHCQGLYARLDNGYAACEQQSDDAKRLRWEGAWLGVLGLYEAAVEEMRRRGFGE